MDVKREILKLAGEMVRGEGMPSPYRDDWPRRLRWHEVEHRAFQTESRVKRWAIRLRELADSL